MRVRQSVTHVPVQRLAAHPANVRENLTGVEEMAASVREHGILTPLTVTEHPDDPEMLLILAGHRRLAGALRAGLTTVPCIVRHGLGRDAVEQTVVMLVENCQRRDLNPMEKAEAYGALRSQNLTLSEISRRVGIGISTISYYLALLDLDDAARQAVREGDLGVTDAITIVRRTRQDGRVRSGRDRRGRPVVAQRPHLSSRHPLSRYVAATCTHSDAPSVGNVGCGACWEQVIRADATGTLAPLADPAVDQMAVERAVSGDPTVRLSAQEKREAVRILHRRRLSDGQIADILHISSRTVERARKQLDLPANCTASGRVA